MTDSFVTQCPHCHTSFRISRAQLGAAHGAVRCGACMRVFNAAQQLLVDQNRAGKAATPTATPAVQTTPTKPATPTAPPAPPAPPQPAAPAQPAVEKKSVDTLWIHDDLDLDSLDLDEELAKLEEQELQLSREFLAMDAASGHLPHDENEDSRHDESWAESLIQDEPGKPAPLAVTQPEAEAEPRAATLPEPAVFAAPPQERDDPVIGSLDTTEDDAAEAIDDGDYRITAEPVPAATARPARSEPALRDDSLLALSEEPLRLDWQQPKKPWGRWIGWGLLNLIAAAALKFQDVAYNFEELARQDQYRPWFEKLCPELGCTLPPKVDTTQIRSTNLVVHSHPQYMDALLVDAILYNRAPFTQPFPLLELRFADLNGQLIASSRFRPSEYLSGELAGQNEMPPQTPIHISLEIKDPGDRAVNYSLSFHSPE